MLRGLAWQVRRQVTRRRGLTRRRCAAWALGWAAARVATLPQHASHHTQTRLALLSRLAEQACARGGHRSALLAPALARLLSPRLSRQALQPRVATLPPRRRLHYAHTLQGIRYSPRHYLLFHWAMRVFGLRGGLAPGTRRTRSCYLRGATRTYDYLFHPF